MLVLIIGLTLNSREKECINKDSINGEWIWAKSIGGFNGGIITPQIVGYTRHLVINDYTIKDYKNDSLFSESQYDLQIRSDSVTGTNKYLFFAPGMEFKIKINDNELVLYHIIWNDGYDDYFIRK